MTKTSISDLSPIVTVPNTVDGWKRLLSTPAASTPYRDLTGLVLKTNDQVFAVGGFSDIFEGQWKLSGKNGRLAIKVFHVRSGDSTFSSKAIRHLKRETLTWAALSHPNILPFLGIAFDIAQSPVLISPLYTNGNAITYINRHPTASRWRLTMDVAQGLQYLHQLNIVHGDVKTDNVLIDDQGAARLADFGCSTIMDCPEELSTESAFSVRFTAPEVFSSSVHTNQSDIYGFALTALHLLSGKLPFYYISTEAAVLSAVRARACPVRSRYKTAVNHRAWDLMNKCWINKAGSRPTMNEVTMRLTELSVHFDQEPLLDPLRAVSSLPPPAPDEQTPFADLTNQVTKIDEQYFAYGGFSEIFKGEWEDPVSGKIIPVAIKLLRGVHTDNAVLTIITRRLNRETRVWHRLSHVNILPFLGVCGNIGPSSAMISPLCDNGNVCQYLINEPEADRDAIVKGVASGLQYLHSNDIIHGDLKGVKCSLISGILQYPDGILLSSQCNILMDYDGQPRLADFGRSKFVDHRGFTTGFAGSARYLAPELVIDEPNFDDDYNSYESLKPANVTKETDVFAFSMVALEVLAVKIPWFYVRQDSTVIALVQDGRRPDRSRYFPTIFRDDVWTLLVDCWDEHPSRRPDISTVVLRLEKMR